MTHFKSENVTIFIIKNRISHCEHGVRSDCPTPECVAADVLEEPGLGMDPIQFRHRVTKGVPLKDQVQVNPAPCVAVRK